MFISNNLDYSYIVQINMSLIELSVLKIQKYIYQATEKCNLSDIYKYQRIFLSSKEFLLITIHKIINVIKKKFAYLNFIIKNF